MNVQRRAPYGIGGILILVIIRIVLSMFQSIIFGFQSVSAAFLQTNSSSFLPIFLFDLMGLLYIVFLIYLFVKNCALFKGYYAAFEIYIMITGIFGIFSISGPQIRQSITLSTVYYIASALTSLLFLIYILSSARVKNTFIRKWDGSVAIRHKVSDIYFPESNLADIDSGLGSR